MDDLPGARAGGLEAHGVRTMNAPLLIAERLEARAVAANAVRSAFYERFGEHLSANW